MYGTAAGLANVTFLSRRVNERARHSAHLHRHAGTRPHHATALPGMLGVCSGEAAMWGDGGVRGDVGVWVYGWLTSGEG